MELIILGCGTSSSVPSINCLLSNRQPPCLVCTEAYQNPKSRNRRGNPSLLIRLLNQKKHILVDCGKTFRQSVLRHLIPNEVDCLHTVLLTHGHADACLGMDDLRDLQKWNKTTNPLTGEEEKLVQEPLQVICHPNTRKEIGERFDYLIQDSNAPIESEKVRKITSNNQDCNSIKPYRWIANLSWGYFNDLEVHYIHGLQVVALPVEHGCDYIAYGFEFGIEYGHRVVYLSDVSRIPQKTEDFLKNVERGPIDILIIDCLFTKRLHGTHLNLSQALDIISEFRPSTCYLTGMSHDFDYYIPPTELDDFNRQNPDCFVKMLYDGQKISLQNRKNIDE